MKAVVFEKFGDPEKVLQLKEVAKPTPKENEVLIKIITAAVNDYDWCMTCGKPYPYRLLFGLFKPKHKIPGMELAGIIEKIGAEAKKFKVGDPVFGDISEFGFGSFAEYICIHENALVKKPENLSFEEAASLSHASGLALQALKDIGNIKEGQKVLINGGGGGVGTIGLQIAKKYNCVVTGVDSEKKLGMMKAIGYDHVLDYLKTDFTKTGEKYDLILDCKTLRAPASYLRALKPVGMYVTVGGTPARLIQLLLFSPVYRWFSTKKIRILSLKTNKELDLICELVSNKTIKTKIDGPYPLERAPELLRYFGEGRHEGKIVLRITEV